MNKSKKTEQQTEFEKPLDIQELAKASGFSVDFLKKAKRQMGLPFYKVGSLVRFRLTDFNHWLEERKKTMHEAG